MRIVYEYGLQIDAETTKESVRAMPDLLRLGPWTSKQIWLLFFNYLIYEDYSCTAE